MPLADKPMYIREPDPLQCGQAVLAMLTGKTVDEMIAAAGTERETTLADMFSVLEKRGDNGRPAEDTGKRQVRAARRLYSEPRNAALLALVALF